MVQNRSVRMVSVDVRILCNVAGRQDGKRGENAEHHHYKEQFNHRKPFLIFIHRRHLLIFSLAMIVFVI